MSDKWALILGSSSGFGAASARALAKAGFNIFGVHLDRKAGMPRVQEVIDDCANCGVQVRFFNKNVASDENRVEIICQIAESLTGEPLQPDEGMSFADAKSHQAILSKVADMLRDHEGAIQAMLHSVAFGALNPFFAEDAKQQTTRAQLDMTLDVMANSLVYWCQDLARVRLLGNGSKVFAMTSAGSHRVIVGYGPVSAAKAALESHVRQLALELAPRGVRVNCFQAGVTDTPALRMIPGADVLKEEAIKRNPVGRLTTPEDIAKTFVALMDSNVQWINGTVIKVDCGEDNV